MSTVISVIIPVYNAEKSIEKSLDSIKNQSWNGDFEIIVVNDGSTDESRNIIESYRHKNPALNIILINQENGGVSKARNAALKIAKGEYIALLDADDEWLAQKTERQMAFLEAKDSAIDFLSCRRKNQKILYPYRLDEQNLAPITFRKLMIRNESQPSTVIFKRKILENTGFFDPQQRHAEDINYWLRISLQNKMFILGEDLILAGDGKRTFGVSGLSANLPEMEKGFQKNLREMHSVRRISKLEYTVYFYFYQCKYMFRLIRDKYLKLEGK